MMITTFGNIISFFVNIDLLQAEGVQILHVSGILMFTLVTDLGIVSVWPLTLIVQVVTWLECRT